MNIMKKHTKILSTVKQYPIPAIALGGLILGGLLHVFYNSQTGNTAWFATLLVGGLPIVWQTFRGMLHKHFASDIVAMMAIVVSIILNDAFPGVIIVLMQSGGKALEDYAYKSAKSSLDVILSRAPKIAIRKESNNVLTTVDVSDIKINDILVVRQGDLIPVDGEIVSSVARIDESSLTGEPMVQTKKIGDQVFSGTVNVDNVFEIKATKRSEDSQYSKIVKLVKKAQEEKAPIQRLADRYAVWFTPLTLGISVIGWLLTNNFETILSVLVVATPCPLIFATPVAVISGINKAAKSGIIVKSGSAIEQIGKAQVVVFDKTGTLTFGTPTVEKAVSFNGITGDEILRRAASLEQLSSHPIAMMVAQKGKEKFGKLPMPANFREMPGAGVEGDVEGDHIIIGAPSIFANLDGKIFNSNIINNHIAPEGRMVAFVGINDRLVGAIIFGDQIRPQVRTMVQDLKKEGVTQTIMLTGDSHGNAKSIATSAGVSSFEAELLPEQKAMEIKKLMQSFKTVIMVGDGINDAPALAASTVGIAMGSRGTAISAEAADIVLLVDNILKVTKIIEIGKRTIAVAKQSISVGLGVSFCLMGIAALGHLPPAIGALLQEALDISVILNALRAR